MSAKNTQVEDATAVKFLDAEATAHELVEALAGLEVDVKGYRAAATEMGSVAEATVRLASGLEDVGRRAAEALDLLVKIGGPEIIAQLTKLMEIQQEHTKCVQELQDLIRYSNSEIERVRASAQAAVDSGENNRLGISKVDSKLTELKELSVAISEYEQRSAKEQARTHSVALWSTWLAFAAVLLSATAVYLLRGLA